MADAGQKWNNLESKTLTGQPKFEQPETEHSFTVSNSLVFGMSQLDNSLRL